MEDKRARRERERETLKPSKEREREIVKVVR
jgi:hypothetical protein